MSNTANYNLKTWATSEVTDSFNNFVFGVAGDVNSNMTKIDTQMKSSADGVAAIKNAPIKTVFASRVSDSYYTATVSDYSAYVNGNVFFLILDTTSYNTLTININSLGTLSVMKYKADGVLYNIEAGDILANVVVVIRYDGTRWLVVGSPTTNPSKMFYPDNIYGGIISSNLNSINVSGFYTAYGTATGAPNTSSSWYIQHINSNDGTVSALQVANSFSTSEVYKRIKTASAWGSWVNVDSSTVVKYSSQTLTSGQKTQACSNISAVEVGDIVNNLTAGGTSVPLSAEQGKTLYNTKMQLIQLWTGTWGAYNDSSITVTGISDYTYVGFVYNGRLVVMLRGSSIAISNQLLASSATQLQNRVTYISFSGDVLSIQYSKQVTFTTTPTMTLVDMTSQPITKIYGVIS